MFSKNKVVKNPVSYASHALNGEKSICPWLVLILGENLVCGGIILNESTILTAAHCVYDQRKVRIFPGVVDRLNLPKGYDSAKIIVHEQYDSENLYNDIAILKLKDKIYFSKHVYSINLPSSSPSVGQKAFVSGFGVKEDGKLSRWLKTFQVTVEISKFCILKYGNDYNSDLQICAGNLFNSLDFCTGDSGGPLYFKQFGTWIVLGIVSFTGKQCSDGFPSVYTNVFSYSPWIRRWL